MSRKTQVAYEAAFQRVVEVVGPENMHINISLTDFEMALRSAIASQIPGTTIVGCNVHYDRVSYKLILFLFFFIFINLIFTFSGHFKPVI